MELLSDGYMTSAIKTPSSIPQLLMASPPKTRCLRKSSPRERSLDPTLSTVGRVGEGACLVVGIVEWENLEEYMNSGQL